MTTRMPERFDSLQICLVRQHEVDVFTTFSAPLPDTSRIHPDIDALPVVVTLPHFVDAGLGKPSQITISLTAGDALTDDRIASL